VQDIGKFEGKPTPALADMLDITEDVFIYSFSLSLFKKPSLTYLRTINSWNRSVLFVIPLPNQQTSCLPPLSEIPLPKRERKYLLSTGSH
jgi:hypothetical protein